MKKNDELNRIHEGLNEIEEKLKGRINVYNDMDINMKENLETLQSSVLEIEKSIEKLNNNIKDEENIFFLGVGSQENKKMLESQERNRIDLNEHIKDLKERIVVEEEKKLFLQSIYDDLFEYGKILDNMDNNPYYGNNLLLEKLKECQKLSKIDHERCYIEIGKVIEEVEKWGKE